MQRQEVALGHAVILTWADSRVFAGWNYEPETPRTPASIRSLGYVVQSNEHSLVITSSLGSKGQSIDDLCIPWGAVTEFDVLPGDYARGGPSEDSIHG